MKKNKLIIGALAAILIVILVVSVYRIFFRKVIDAEINNVSIISLDTSYLETLKTNYIKQYGISEEIGERVVKNPSEYRLVEYSFLLKNISEKKRAQLIKLSPEFPKEMKKIVIGYSKIDDGEAPISLEPTETLEYNKDILVKVDGKSENDIIKIAKGVKFNVTGITGNWIFDIGYNSRSIKFGKNK